jgi:hypothetical protein
MPQRAGTARPIGHLTEGEPFNDVGVAVRIEVLVRAARQARLAQRLEVLLRVTGDSRLIERPAE